MGLHDGQSRSRATRFSKDEDPYEALQELADSAMHDMDLTIRDIRNLQHSVEKVLDEAILGEGEE